MSQSLQGAGGIGGLLATVTGSLTYHDFSDANGNVTQMINAADGAIAAHYEYDPFGNEVHRTGNRADANPFRFSTKYYDPEVNLYYYGYRYYSPELGWWINRDPMEEAGGANLYAFAANDPVNRYDLLGLTCSLQEVVDSAVTGAVMGYLTTRIAKEAVTWAIRTASAQIAPVAGQIIGLGITVWGTIQLGRTIYTVYVNADRIQAALKEFYDDPQIIGWINCLTPQECNQLANQLGLVIGSAVANHKEMRAGIRRVRDIIKRFVAAGKGKFKNSRLSSEIGAVGIDINASMKAQYVFDPRASRYRNTTTGRFVSERDLPWPSNRGFQSSSQQTLKPGTIVDRYGKPSGRYAGQPGATASQRGMAQGADSGTYTQYRVVKTINAEVGAAAPVPEFGASGGATQYLFDKPIEQLVKDGILEVVR